MDAVNEKPHWLRPEFMGLALEEARKAALMGEVPVGALVILDHDPETGEALENPLVISQAHNNREEALDPAGHAELLAIRAASASLKRWRLTGCTLYVTLEPCLMCSGALVLSRVDRVVFGAKDSKAGAVESLYQTLDDKRLNHQPQVLGGIQSEECGRLLKDFFAKKRASQTSR